MQTISDLLFTGVLGLTDYIFDLWSVFVYFCSYSGFTLYWEYNLLVPQKTSSCVFKEKTGEKIQILRHVLGY